MAFLPYKRRFEDWIKISYIRKVSERRFVLDCGSDAALGVVAKKGNAQKKQLEVGGSRNAGKYIWAWMTYISKSLIGWN